MSALVRVGVRISPTPMGAYSDLLLQETREQQDDGRIILHAGDCQPICADCEVGRLQWAEAGYVPWHRICDRCGSHWDLHQITWGPAKPRQRRPTLVRVPDKYLCGHRPMDPSWCEDCGDEPVPVVREVPAPEYVRWVDRRGEVPLDPSEPIVDHDDEIVATWGDLLALVTPAMWADAEAEKEQERMAGMIVVPCAWARRARFQ